MDWQVRGERGGTQGSARPWSAAPGGIGVATVLALFTAGCGGGQSAPAFGSVTTAPASGPVTSGTTDADRTAACARPGLTPTPPERRPC